MIWTSEAPYDVISSNCNPVTAVNYYGICPRFNEGDYSGLRDDINRDT